MCTNTHERGNRVSVSSAVWRVSMWGWACSSLITGGMIMTTDVDRTTSQRWCRCSCLTSKHTRHPQPQGTGEILFPLNLAGKKLCATISISVKLHRARSMCSQYIKGIFYIKQGWRHNDEVLRSVPGCRVALFLFLAFSVEVSRAGHSVNSGPLEPLNWRGSLLVAGSKDRGLSPETTHKPKEASL